MVSPCIILVNCLAITCKLQLQVVREGHEVSLAGGGAAIQTLPRVDPQPSLGTWKKTGTRAVSPNLGSSKQARVEVSVAVGTVATGTVAVTPGAIGGQA